MPVDLSRGKPPSSTTVIDPADGSIKGGTIQALVERLTTHEVPDQTFIKAFMMTFKSFTTVDELFDHLVARFGIKPPPGLAADEFEKWTNLKQKIVQMRVLNTLKSMVTDDDVLDKEDTPILFRMKQFLGREEVAAIPASKHLRILLDRALQSGESGVKMVNKPLGPPPTPVLPKSNKKPKLIDIDALEMARQLTLIESQLFQKIRPMECLQRAREQKQKSESSDNITAVIQTSNRIANWVAEQVLSKEDSRRRASTVKHFIMIADRCRSMNNFSSMIAITSGLNTPPIRRLKRTWEQVPQRYVAMFSTCEQTIDSNKNFTKYRQLMAGVEPPCVPFIGVFLSTLQFIQDGNPDELPGGLVNFRKRQKASEVIMDIKRWQQLSFNFHPILAISTFIEDSLAQFLDERALSDHFWMLSLEREPKEREDEKMARLLQESGFL
ncbi:ras GEF [Fistulina hepatica ATCC 64428]|uniref:Ras GEF n=1 Tax=Fistulina hepatica ATCC 64428 TaxID=1128425 RepID=A0A0D7A6E0_9AGAR|nr:ras GEF [Fistulina hepatica ATCC 64428]